MRLTARMALPVTVVGALSFSASASLPPSKTAELWSCPREKAVTLAPGELLSEVVDLGLFGPFAAGTTVEDAARIHGNAEALFSSAHHPEWRYALYRTPDSVIEVAYEPGGSSCVTYHRRTVYAYPLRESWPLNRVLRGTLLQRVQLPEMETRLLIMQAGDRQDRAWLLIRGGEVQMINWYRMSDGTGQTR